MAKKNIDYKMHISENKELIDLFEDFWDIHQIMRRDYYDIKSLGEFLNNNKFLNFKEKNNNKFLNFYKDKKKEYIFVVENKNEKINDYLCQIDSLKAKYEEYDNEVVNDHTIDEDEDEDEIAIDKEDSTPFATINKNKKLDIVENLFLKIKKYISLSEQIEDLVNQILDFLYDCIVEINEKMANIYNENNIVFSSRRQQILLERVFDNTIDQDKIINYEININNNNQDLQKKLKRLIKKESARGYILLKKRDLRYIIEKKKRILISEYEHTIVLLNMCTSKQQSLKIDKLNQILMNITFIGVVGTVVSSLPVIFNFQDKYGCETSFLYLCLIVIIIVVLAIILNIKVFRQKE